MQLATISRTDNDLIAAWQAANGAAWCHRLAATITHAACEENQRRSFGDLRCQGCSGLDNQVVPQLERPALVIVWDADKEPDGPSTADAAVTDRPRCNLDDEELEDFLAEMFPIDDPDDDDGEEEQERVYLDVPPEPTGRRVPVYVGRCARCGDGYMSHVLELQFDVRDEGVYRCLSCGWRTSPQYENNRTLFAAGGVI